MADNVDFIRGFFQRMPDFRVIVRNIVVFGVVFGSITAPLFSELTGLKLGLSVLVSILFIYLVPALLLGEITSWFVSSSRCWAYITGLFNQIILFIFLLVVQLTNTAFELELAVLGLLTAYSFSMIMIMSVRGKIDFTSVICGLIYPAAVLLPTYILSGAVLEASRTLYFQIGVFVLAPLFSLILLFKLLDLLIHSNMNVSLLDFPPAFLLAEPTKVTGVNGNVLTGVYHQALRIEGQDEESEKVFTVPWVHSGPAGGFGSGLIFPRLTDENTFYLHIPSNHTLNLSDPSDIRRFEEAPEAEKSGKASKLLELTKEGFTLWGRKYSGGKMIFVENRNVDDYLPSVAYSLKEKYDDLCFIDLHNQLKDQPEREMQHMDKDRKVIEDAVAEMMEKLEEAEMKTTKQGFQLEMTSVH